MDPESNLLTSETIQMLVSSMTAQGSRQLSELEVERFLNALTHTQTKTPTGVNPVDPNRVV